VNPCDGDDLRPCDTCDCALHALLKNGPIEQDPLEVRIEYRRSHSWRWVVLINDRSVLHGDHPGWREIAHKDRKGEAIALKCELLEGRITVDAHGTLHHG
jgi:hypothetical protein